MIDITWSEFQALATAAGADVLLSGWVSEKRKNVLTGDKVQTWAVSPALNTAKVCQEKAHYCTPEEWYFFHLWRKNLEMEKKPGTYLTSSMNRTPL